MDGFWHDISWVLPLRSDTATVVADAFNYLGYGPFFIISLPLIYWLWSKEVGTRLTIIVILTAVTNGLLKDIFDDPRPDKAFALDPRVSDSYGLPSGHAQVATAMWFWIAYELRRAWFWPIAAVIVAGVMFARLYSGVHDVEDVTVGFGLGIATLLLFAWFISPNFAWWRALPPLIQVGVLMAVQVPLYLLWPEPDGPGTTFAIGGMLAGWWSGVLIEQRHIRYKRHPNWGIAIGAALVAIAISYFGLTNISNALEMIGLHPVASAWIEAAIIALFVTAAAPWAFVKLRLATTEPVKATAPT